MKLPGSSGPSIVPWPSLSEAKGDVTGEPSKRFLALVVLACAAGFSFDLSEIAFGSALSGIFSTPPYRLPTSQLSWLLGAAYAGAIVGPLIFGGLGDRTGRRRALIAVLIVEAVTALLSALSPNPATLTGARALAGVALGAYPPLMIAYLAESVPTRLRGRLTLLTVAIAYLAPPATIFLIRWFSLRSPLGLSGWRWVIALDGLGALVAAALFLLQTNRRGAFRADMAVSAQSRPGRRVYVPVFLLSLLAPWATVAFPLLSAAMLLAKGFDLSHTLLFVAVANAGPFLGTLAATAVFDRFDRRVSLIICTLGMSASAIAFYGTISPIWLMVSGTGFNLFISLYMPAFTLYAAELFPAEIRASATSLAWSANRLAAVLVPVLLLPWLHVHALGPVFVVILLSLAASLAVILLAAPATPAEPTR